MKKQSSLSEIVHLLADLVVYDTYQFHEFLKKLITLITQIIPVNSCLIYIFDRQNKTLILCASKSDSKQTHDESLGKITMREGEGITGWVAEHGTTVVLNEKAYEDDRFKFFKQLPEDNYEAFLSVPIKDREGVVGVVNLQHEAPYQFTAEQIDLLETVVKIIAAAFESVVLERKVGTLTEKLEERKLVERAKGILMKKEKIPEKRAYDLIRKESMKKRKSMREIAEAVILLYE
ncbi:MAG: ANTAR domain-containing protein [Patescibacteria group bacterium]